MVRFTDHAREQMEERGISEEDVKLVIADAESTRPSEQREDRRIFTRWIGKRRIGVVVTPADPSPKGDKLVITAFIEQEED